MLTKKRLARLTVIMTLVYSFLFLLLPESVVGERAENMLLFAPKVFFLGLTAAITTGMVLIFMFKREFVSSQLASFNRYKHLLLLLVKRDFVSRYRKSILGVVWSLLNPLLTMLVITMVFSYVFARAIENFPVYLLSGQLIFHYYSESTGHAMKSIISSEGIIKKVYVPKYIFPLSKIISSLVNVVFSFIAFLLVFIITRAPFHWTMLLLPVPILYTFVFSLGVGMLLAAMDVFFRDLSYLYGIFLTLLMYSTPIFYPFEILPENLKPIMGFNPLFHFVDYFRSLALWGTVPDLWSNIVCIGFALAALCIGLYVFMKKQDRYILYI